MNVKSVEKEATRASVTVELTREELEPALNRAYLKYRKDIMIPGFRKGHAPRMVIEAAYGKHVFFEDAVEDMFPDIYKDAVLTHDIRPVGRPSVSKMDIADDGAVTLTIVTDLYPVAELGEYKNLEIEKAEVEVKESEVEAELGDPALDELLTPYLHQQLVDEIELLDGAAEEFDLDKVLRGELSPVFFGSALTNFGVEPFLENFLRLTPTPLARVDSLTGETVDPCRDEFSAFIFKIQANMNKAHRDRIAFMRICSGKFERGMEAYHVQEGKNIKLATGTQLMAQDRAIVDEAYAGDIIGLFDPGIFSIGDTLCTGKKKVQFAGIPTFSPEHFARIEQKDTMKRKQFVKGMEQIAQEGAIQIFREVGGGMEEVVVGVVGVLQLEVLEYRLNTEYNVEIRMQQLPFEQLRWVQNDPDTYNLRDLDLTSDTKAVEDMKGNRLLLFTSDWAVRWAETHNESLQLSEFGNI